MRRTLRPRALTSLAATVGVAAVIAVGGISSAPANAVTLPCVTNLLGGADFGTLAPGETHGLTPAPAGYSYQNGNIVPGGTYTVMSFDSSTAVHPDPRVWHGLAGHTTGANDDAYVGVNGSDVSAVFYSRTFTGLLPGVHYDAGVWAVNAWHSQGPQAGGTIRPEFGIRVVRTDTGATVAQSSTGPLQETLGTPGERRGPEAWTQSKTGFTTSSNPAIDYRVEFYNISVGGYGNDFAFDDLSLDGPTKSCPAMTVVKKGVVTDTNADGITDAGDTVVYSVAVTNTGDLPVTGLTVSDPMLAKTGITLTCPATALDAGQSVTCTASGLYAITAADALAGKVDNTAQASVTTIDQRTMTDSDSVSIPVVGPPSLTLKKTVTAIVDADGTGTNTLGDKITYGFLVTNTGPSPLTQIEVSDPLLAGMTITCASTTLVPGAATTCTPSGTYAITAADVLAGKVDNTAKARGVGPAGTWVDASDSTSTVVGAATFALGLAKRVASIEDVNGDHFHDAGDKIWYSFLVTNNGNGDVIDPVVNDPMIGAVTCPKGRIRPGADIECKGDRPHVIDAADASVRKVTNTATASATDPHGATVISASASATVTVIDPAIDLAVPGGPEHHSGHGGLPNTGGPQL